LPLEEGKEHFYAFIHIYPFIPWSIVVVLLETLRVVQLLKKFLVFSGI
jgi:hypothetical protein